MIWELGGLIKIFNRKLFKFHFFLLGEISLFTDNKSPKPFPSCNSSLFPTFSLSSLRFIWKKKKKTRFWNLKIFLFDKSNKDLQEPVHRHHHWAAFSFQHNIGNTSTLFCFDTQYKSDPNKGGPNQWGFNNIPLLFLFTNTKSVCWNAHGWSYVAPSPPKF